MGSPTTRKYGQGKSSRRPNRTNTPAKASATRHGITSGRIGGNDASIPLDEITASTAGSTMSSVISHSTTWVSDINLPTQVLPERDIATADGNSEKCETRTTYPNCIGELCIP